MLDRHRSRDFAASRPHAVEEPVRASATSPEHVPSSPQLGALGSARTLALVRIVAGLVIAIGGDLHGAPRFAELDPQLSALPAGLAWLGAWSVPRATAEALRWLVCGAAIAGALGSYARWTWTVVAAGSLLLLALPQRVGAVTHCHHLVWVAALLAVSPCADVWSADAHFEARPLRARGSYEVPLMCLRALVAAVYFFPGLHKLLAFAGGVDPGAWLRAQLDWKWLQRGHAPALPFALGAPVCTALALAALSFELALPLLVAFRRTRLLALLAALAFHVGTAWLLFIHFESLAALLVALIDLGGGPFRWRDAALSTRVVGSLLVLGACTTGALAITQSYPFACYPTFAEQPPATMPSARVELGACALPRPRSNPEWVQAFRIAGAYGDALTQPRARAYLLQALRQSNCPRQANSQVRLILEQLRWDDGVRVVGSRLAYATTLSSLGAAPAGAASGGSSPPK
jgi:Vitamin K-dependent gamma-carboxylase